MKSFFNVDRAPKALAIAALATVITALTATPGVATAHQSRSQTAGAPGGRHTVLVTTGPHSEPSDGTNLDVAISGNGRYVAFNSGGTTLVAADTNRSLDIFVRDVKRKTTQRVSVTSQGQQVSGNVYDPAISANGRFVVFGADSSALVPGDTNGRADLFLHDRRSGSTQRVSVGTGGVQADADSSDGSLSADGRYLAFTSLADNLVPGDTNGQVDVFVRDLRRGVTSRVSISSSGAQTGAGPGCSTSGDTCSDEPQISASGHQVVFTSFATNLVPGDTNNISDVFVRDLRRGTTIRASVGSGGAQATDGLQGYGSGQGSISADGRVVTFQSYAQGLVDDGSTAQGDAYARDLVTGVTERVALGPGGVLSNDSYGGAQPDVSANGRYVLFYSNADNLVSDDMNGAGDLFVRDLARNVTSLVSIGAGGQTNGFTYPIGAIDRNGGHIAFISQAANLVPDDTNGTLDDVFVR
jgi:Tol biopolymer transport system component